MKNSLITTIALVLLAGCCRFGNRCVTGRGEDVPDEPPAPASNAQKVPGVHTGLRAVKSWCLYYGAATADTVERLGGYGLVVIDANALGPKSRETISALKARGCLVAGYLSMIEVAKWHRYRDRIPREWYILADGKPWNPWGGKDVGWDANLAASLAEPGWREMLVELVRSEVLDFGCDGVFMDTVEDLDFASLPADERPKQLEGFRQLLAALDERYPDAFFIANRSLQGSLPVAAEHIDALCWESYAPKYFDDAGTRTWMDGVAKNIEAERARRPFVVLSLMDIPKNATDIETTRKRMREISAEHGYVPYCTVGGYSSLP